MSHNEDKMHQSLPIGIRQLREYFVGRLAFSDGVLLDSNPCNGFNERCAWFAGWLDARTNSVLSRVFKKYDISFP